MEKYKPIIEEINKSIDEFNKYLNEANIIKLLDNDFDEPKKYTQLYSSKYVWGDVAWPNSEERGVYFLMAYNKKDPNKIAVYIGKASLEVMGHRIYAHLKKYSPKGPYLIFNKKKEEYIIELISSVSFKNKGVLAPALEEHLITNLGKKINLINKVGN